MSDIETHPKETEKQAEFEAAEMTKKNREREEERRQKAKVKAEHHALLQRFETLKTNALQSKISPFDH